MSRQGQSGELVFCHNCDHRWYKEEHGLVCPRCNSEFTELVCHCLLWKIPPLFAALHKP